MRDNFRPNIRLVTNILLAIGTFTVAYHLAPIGNFYRQKTLCVEKKYIGFRETTENIRKWYDQRYDICEDYKEM